MTRLVWDNVEDRLFETGIDRAVLYHPTKPAVVWNGLASVVDSGGGQATSTYYVDGRKYLTVVTPREYQGKISAYTFPDEFADLCGIVEATDGLFLDEQVPGQFGLSYRTLYGDNTNYKIHLIYGVTAAMADRTYNSLSDNTDAVAMEFDISGVPESIAGFRPTAHAIVDTRHMDADKIATIENLLYGTDSVDARLPSLQNVFDLMDFGDVVKITDNGDGTWMAEGSYKYITVNADGTFVIDNIYTVDNGDGTYELSDAPITP